ncbi:MAG: amino acid ABC transporter permease [Clostridia bacterium]|nr:amino acid ABC transporter permease [Clostridia bacterium]
MYSMNFRFLREYLPDFLQGTKITVILTSSSLVFGFILGVIFALLHNSKNRALHLIALSWVEFIRNTPFLVQLFFLYYGLPELGISTSPITTGIIALSLNVSAANCEVIRAGLLGVKKPYIESSLALGFSPFQTVLHTTVPIAVRLCFRSLMNNFINLVLTSSVVFSITVIELMGTGKLVSTWTSRPIEVFLTVMLAYCVITFTLTAIGALVNKKIAIQL